MSVGDVIACAVWLVLCIAVRHEYVEQHRVNGRGWKGPGA